MGHFHPFISYHLLLLLQVSFAFFKCLSVKKYHYFSAQNLIPGYSRCKNSAQSFNRLKCYGAQSFNIQHIKVLWWCLKHSTSILKARKSHISEPLFQAIFRLKWGSLPTKKDLPLQSKGLEAVRF